MSQFIVRLVLKGELDRFSEVMLTPIESDGAPMRDLIEARLSLPVATPEVPTRLRQRLPAWGAFEAAKPVLRQLQAALESAGFDGVLARAPVRLLKGVLADDRDVVERIERTAPRVSSAIAELETTVSEIEQFIGSEELTWRELAQVVSLCEALQPLAAAECLNLLDPDSPKSHRLQDQRKKLAKKQKLAEQACSAASGWQEATPTNGLSEHLAIAREKEGRFFSFFSSQWRAAKRLKKLYYNASDNMSVTAALDVLSKRVNLDEKLAKAEAKFASDFGVPPTQDIFAIFEKIWSNHDRQSDAERHFLRICIEKPDQAARKVLQLAREANRITGLDRDVSSVLMGYAGLRPTALSTALDDLVQDVRLVPEFADLLSELDTVDEQVSETVRNLDLPQDQIEVAVLDHVLDRAIRRDRTLGRFDGRRLSEIVGELKAKLVS